MNDKDFKFPFKVKIIKSSRDTYWYSHLIGETYEVFSGNKTYGYCIKNGDCILKDDCEIVKDNIDHNKGFIIGDWYKCSCNDNFYQFNGIKHNKDGEDCFIASAVICPIEPSDNFLVGYNSKGRNNHLVILFNPDNKAPMEEVNKFLPKTTTHKKGTWYEYRHTDGLYYLKCSQDSANNKLYYSEYIKIGGEHSVSSGWYKNKYVTNIELPIHKLQNYLPNGHIDKIPNKPQYEVVHCTSQEEWNSLLEIFNPINVSKSKFSSNYCLVIDAIDQNYIGTHASYDWFKRQNTVFISFADYVIKQRGYDLNGKSNTKIDRNWLIEVTEENKNKVFRWLEDNGESVDRLIYRFSKNWTWIKYNYNFEKWCISEYYFDRTLIHAEELIGKDYSTLNSNFGIRQNSLTITQSFSQKSQDVDKICEDSPREVFIFTTKKKEHAYIKGITTIQLLKQQEITI